MKESVLPVLCGSANGIEVAETCSAAAIAVGDGLAEAILNLLGLAAEHGRLIGDAYALEMSVGIESRRNGVLESSEESPPVASLADIAANDIRFLQVEDDEVMAVALGAKSARGGGAGFLMGGLAVNDAGDLLGGVLPDALPDTHDVAASGVHDLAALGLDGVNGRHLCTKGGDDDDILGVEGGKLLLGGMGLKVANAHGGELRIDIGVVDDLAEKENAAVRKDLVCRVGEVDGALDAVAKAEFLGEANDGAALLDHATVAAGKLDEFAAVMALNLRLDASHHVRCAEIDAALLAGSDGGVAHDAGRRTPGFMMSKTLPEIMRDFGGSGSL